MSKLQGALLATPRGPGCACNSPALQATPPQGLSEGPTVGVKKLTIFREKSETLGSEIVWKG
jgi:hypothetical protein